MSSPPDSYSKLHQTLTRMPPNSSPATNTPTKLKSVRVSPSPRVGKSQRHKSLPPIPYSSGDDDWQQYRNDIVPHEPLFPYNEDAQKRDFFEGGIISGNTTSIRATLTKSRSLWGVLRSTAKQDAIKQSDSSEYECDNSQIASSMTSKTEMSNSADSVQDPLRSPFNCAFQQKTKFRNSSLHSPGRSSYHSPYQSPQHSPRVDRRVVHSPRRDSSDDEEESVHDIDSQSSFDDIDHDYGDLTRQHYKQPSQSPATPQRGKTIQTHTTQHNDLSNTQRTTFEEATSIIPPRQSFDDRSLMDDILLATNARGENGELLSRDEILAEMGVVLPPRDEGAVRRCSRSRPMRHIPRQSSARHAIPDDHTWVQEVLRLPSGLVPPESLQSLLDSVNGGGGGMWQSQRTLQSTSSAQTWMEDVLRAPPDTLPPEILQTLLDSVHAGGDGKMPPQNHLQTISNDRSWKEDTGDCGAIDSKSDTSIQYRKQRRQQEHKCSIVVQDTRGPVPSADDLFGSGSCSFVSGDFFVVQRNDCNGDGVPSELLEAMGLSEASLEYTSTGQAKQSSSENSKNEKSLSEDELIAQELLSQLGADVDYRSIPKDVLSALGISERLLKDGDRSSCKSESDDSKPQLHKQMYRQRSSPDDEVSWVDHTKLPKTPHQSSNEGGMSVGSGNNSSESRRSNRRSILLDSLKMSKSYAVNDDSGPIPIGDALEASFSESLDDIKAGGSLCSSSRNEHRSNSKRGTGEDRKQPFNSALYSMPTNNSGSFDSSIEHTKPSMGFLGRLSQRRNAQAVSLEMRSEVLQSIQKARG